MRLTAISWPRLTAALARRIAALEPADGGAFPRVAVDGAPAARPAELAGALAEELPPLGRRVQVIGAEGFLRPASLRYEFGREDPDAYYDERLDVTALWREVFTPLEPGGTGRVLPDLWDPVTDRATRSPYAGLGPGTVVILHGPLLLHHWFPFDLTVHLALTPAALARRTPPAEHWTLPAFARYEEEAKPAEAADVLVRVDDPRHPAWTG
ncbi:uridine kinase [Streptomyces sp. NPDC051940]|uniref:uridine kinase n=1 Tax=Streptomyces sp. NPDC051940 TaxID=3155675 RepID=UPI00341D12E5